jgi:lipopolysaccharide heptosyltransferase I
LKILILKPSSLGDVVQALPVLRLIKQHWPTSEIYWWVDSRYAPLLDGDPDLTGIVRFERNGWTSTQRWLGLWRSIQWTRHESFDLVIDLQCLARSAVFGWLANGKLTIGLDESREGARAFYDLIVPRGSYHTHAVDWYLAVLPLLKVPVHRNFQWMPERPSVAAGICEKWPEIKQRRWIILQPGARWLNKRWPADYFADLLRRLAAAYDGVNFAVMGGGEDQSLGEKIAEAQPSCCLDLTGKLSLPEMVEWIRSSELMVTNDTGPMHVAAALGKPVVALFGPTEPTRTGPYGQIEHALQLDLPCVPCMRSRCTYFKPLECLRGLPPSAVFDAACKRLGAAGYITKSKTSIGSR